MKAKIEKLDHFGRGLTHINNKVCFISNALPDEIVEFTLIKDLKKYSLGKVTKLITISPYRIQNACPHNNLCGGCVLRNLSYEKENKYKKEKVVELLSKLANIPKNIIKDTVYSLEENYRNKVTFHVKNKTLGYYKEESNDLVAITNCALLSPKINALISLLNKIITTNEVEEIVVRTSNDNTKTMVKLTGSISSYAELLNSVDVLEINGEIKSVESKIISTIGDTKYYLSPDSFFQVNAYLTEKLYDKVKEEVKRINPENTLDLYCGTGTIGIYINKYTKTVLGVDSNSSNITDAINNKKLNNIENISFISAKVEDVIESFDNKYDLVIVDPPRAGLDQKTTEILKRLSPKNIIYVSCDPATLGRDLKNLTEEYTVTEVTPFNMFPRTYHVEVVCCLSRKERSANINE